MSSVTPQAPPETGVKEKEGALPVSVVFAALTAAIVGFGGSVALILEAARALGATPAETVSWVAAAYLGMGGTSLYLSLRHRMPIVTAWSTPGAALIAAGAAGIGMETAVGVFLFTAVLLVATAAFRPLGRLIERIPASVASAMLAGVLVRFCLDVVGAGVAAPALVLPLVAAFFPVLVWAPVLAVPAVLLLGIGLAAAGGLIGAGCCSLAVSMPVLITPNFDLGALIGLGLPLYLITMASQNLPGLAVLKADGYRPPAAATMAPTGVASFILAPFGAHSLCLSAITASICTGPGCHPRPERRWLAGPLYAFFCLLIAVFADAFIALMLALPAVLITAFAGLALFGPLKGSLKAALGGPAGELDAAALTFVVAASGVTLLGVGAAVWALAAGLVLLALRRLRAAG